MGVEKCGKLSIIAAILLAVAISIAWADDTNRKEVGVEWVEKYNGHGSDLHWTKEEAVGFYQELGNKGWKKQFNWGNNLAWESDFEKRSVGGKRHNLCR